MVKSNINLKSNFAGVEFENPIILGSATPGWDGKRLKEAAESGAGGVVCKTIGPPQTWAQHPRCGRFALIKHNKQNIGMINLELFTTQSKETWINKDLKVAKEGGGKVIASFLALPNPEETALLAKEIEETGVVDLLELNVSCPMPADTVGMHIGKKPELTKKQVESVKKEVNIPLAVKMTPNVSDLIDVARAVKNAGGDGIVISNSVRAFAGINIDTGKPVLPAHGGYTGPAIKPIIQRLIAEVKTNVDIPVMAVGGVMTWEDIVEYIMLGADVVQTVTAVMWNGNKIYSRFLNGVERYMEEKGYNSLDEFKGESLKHITSVEEYAKNPKLVVEANNKLCTGCKKCLKVCFYDALKFEEENLIVDKEKCDGCGLCVELCPVDALKMV